MSNHEQSWDRLVKAARQAPPRPRPDSAPPGFATRVVARWHEQAPPSLLSVWKFLSLRVLAFGCAVMVASLAASYGVIRDEWLAPRPDISVQLIESTGAQAEEVLLP